MYRSMILTMALLAAMPAHAKVNLGIPKGECRIPAKRRGNTDWFSEAGWGVFVHFLWDCQCVGQRSARVGTHKSWDECVSNFDTERFASDIAETGAKYVIFTMMQRTRYIIAPNETYNRLTGYKTGEACSTRDLVADLIASLKKRDIKLMLYWTGDGPRQDAQGAKGMGGWNGKISDQYVQNWTDARTDDSPGGSQLLRAASGSEDVSVYPVRHHGTRLMATHRCFHDHFKVPSRPFHAPSAILDFDAARGVRWREHGGARLQLRHCVPVVREVVENGRKTWPAKVAVHIVRRSDHSACDGGLSIACDPDGL